MIWEVIVVGAALLLIFVLAVWRIVLQMRLVRLVLRRLFGRDQ